MNAEVKALDGSVGGELDPPNEVELIEEDFIDLGEEEIESIANEGDEPSLEETLKNQDITALEKEARQAVEELTDLANQSSLINTKKEEVRARMETKGINRHALSAAVKVSKMDEEKLDGYDLSMIILRRAIGNPIQNDLFDQ